jgi:hypothetical protein
METLEFGLISLHKYLHNPTKMLLIFRFSNPEAFKRILSQLLWEYHESKSWKLYFPHLPLSNDRLLNIKIALSVFITFGNISIDRSLKELNPSEIECYLILPTFFPYLFPIVNEIFIRFLHPFIVFELLITLPDVMLHVSKFNKSIRWFRLRGRNFNKLVKDARH